MWLNLSVERLAVTKWGIDAAHAVHDDYKSHSGDNYIHVTMLLDRYFIQEQGYKLGPSVIYQDNESAILVEVNGKGSTPKQTKNIKARYFFVQDKVESGDVLTKPQQGTESKVFRGILINIPIEYSNEDPYKMDKKWRIERLSPVELNIQRTSTERENQATGQSINKMDCRRVCWGIK